MMELSIKPDLSGKVAVVTGAGGNDPMATTD